jgi:hypothetical protein
MRATQVKSWKRARRGYARMRTIMLSAILTVALTSSAQSNFITGNDLLRMCTGPAAENGACTGYLEGVIDTQDILERAAGNAPCLPPGTNIQEVRDVVVAYLEMYPPIRTLSASFTVGSVISVQWHCGAKRKPNWPLPKSCQVHRHFARFRTTGQHAAEPNWMARSCGP